MATWDEDFEGTPAGSDSPATIDNKIQELKEAITERIGNQHTEWEEDSTGGLASKDWLHKAGSAVLWSQNGEPTITVSAAQDGALWWDEDDEILKRYDHATTSWIEMVRKEPIGTIKMYAGAAAWADNVTIPGWYACTTANEAAGHVTVDLQDKFVRGSTASGSTGGSDTDTLTLNHLPAHTHNIGNHTHRVVSSNADSEDLSTSNYLSYNWDTAALDRERYLLKGTSTAATLGLTSTPSADPTHSTGFAAGSITAVDTVPAYCTVIFIQRKE